jgi:hypothetical protein
VSDLQLLQEFHPAKLTILLRHQAAARLVPQYDVNNTYQYLINRDEVHLSWLAAAIVDLGGVVDGGSPDAPERRITGKGADSWRELAVADAHDAQAFVDGWRPRVEAMTNARHRKMLQVVLGETLEQKRFFEQAAAGQLDLLGRRPDHVGPRVGEVLPTRWIE